MPCIKRCGISTFGRGQVDVTRDHLAVAGIFVG
jgi:hypothetical protein